MSEKSRLTRRALLRALAAAGVSAVAAACRGKNTPTALPATRAPGTRATATALPQARDSRLSMPFVSRAGEPPPIAVSPLETPAVPSQTPSPVATQPPPGTPRPTNTPRPSPTPFPPGPPTKLGLFVGWNNPAIRDMLRTGNVTMVKTLEYDPGFATEIKKLSPKTLIIARINLPQVNLAQMNDPQGAARAFVDKLLPIAGDPRRAGLFDGWEAYNEPVVDNAEQMGRLAAFEAERTRLLAEKGIRSVVGNFAAGTPSLELWPHFRPALEAAIAYDGYLGLHEYTAPTMQQGSNREPADFGVSAEDEGWLTLRYRKVYRGFLQPNKLTVPILFTEIGIDGGVGNRPGPDGKGWIDFAGYWRENGLGADAAGVYVQQLAWYDAHLQQDSYVLGSAIFAAAAPPGWQSFEILNDVGAILRQYLSVHPLRG